MPAGPLLFRDAEDGEHPAAGAVRSGPVEDPPVPLGQDLAAPARQAVSDRSVPALGLQQAAALEREIADRTAGWSTPSSAISLISAAMLNQPPVSRAYSP